MKPLDLTDIASASSAKKSKLPLSNSKHFAPKHLTPFEEDSVLSSRSLFARNRDSSTYQKYLKLLDPSFLKEEQEAGNTHVPPKIMKLLPLQRKKSEDWTKLQRKEEEKMKMKGVLLAGVGENNGLVETARKNPLKSEGLFELTRLINEKLEQEKLGKQKKIQSCNDISSIKAFRNEEKSNQSIVIKDYYRTDEDEKSNVFEKLSLKEKKSNVYFQIFEHSHNGKMLDTDLESIKEKLMNSYQEQDRDNSMISNRTKLIDLNYIMENSAMQDNEHKSLIVRSNTSSLHQQSSLLRDLKLPTARKEIKDLEDWLNTMVSSVNSKNLDLQSQFMNIQMVYTAALKELIRQVSLHCSERASLIQKIWDDYLEIVEKAVIFEKQKNSKIESEQINEITKIHSLYQSEINNLTTQYNKALERLESLQHDFEKSQTEKSYALKQLAMVKKKSANTQDSYLSLRREYDKILGENYNLKLIADDNLTPDSPLKIGRLKNARVAEITSSVERGRTAKNSILYSANKTSVVGHMLEMKENDSMFTRKELIDTFHDKRAVNANPSNSSNPNGSGASNQTPRKPSGIKVTVERNLKNEEISPMKAVDETEAFELEDIGIDTHDLRACCDAETMTEVEDAGMLDERIETRKSSGGTIDEDYGTLKENCYVLEDILDLSSLGPKKEQIMTLLDLIRSKARILVSKNSRLNFIEHELANLKEEVTKLKIEINEIEIERDQFKELDVDRQSDFMKWLMEFDKVKNENKLIKRNLKDFHQSVENKKNLLGSIDNDQNFENFRKSVHQIFTKNINTISSFRDSFEIQSKEEASDSEDNDDEPVEPRQSSIFQLMKSKKAFKHSIKRVYSVNTVNADRLLHEIHRKSENATEKNESAVALPLNLLLKFMCKIYQEKEKQDKSMIHVPLHVTCYEMLLNRYGLKHVADQNLKKIFSACLLYKNKNHRICVFTKLLGLDDETETDVCVYYINCLRFFNQNCNLKIHQDFKEKVFVDTATARKLINELFNEKSAATLADYIKEFQTKGSEEKPPTIEFDLLMIKILEVYANQKDEMKNHLKYLFYAADLNQDQYIEFYEFVLIFRHIEAEKFNFDEVRRLFVEESDCIVPVSGERAISFVKFISLAIEFHLFDEAKTKKFSEGTSVEEQIKNIEDLRNNYMAKIEQLKIRFI